MQICPISGRRNPEIANQAVGSGTSKDSVQLASWTSDGLDRSLHYSIRHTQFSTAVELLIERTLLANWPAKEIRISGHSRESLDGDTKDGPQLWAIESTDSVLFPEGKS